MEEEVQTPVEEVPIEEIAQPEQELEIETTEIENEETPEPSAEIDEEAVQKEEARKHFQERQSRREREEAKERENEYLRQQLQALQSQQPVAQNRQPQAPPQDPNRPNFDEYLENGYTAQQFYDDSRAYEKRQEAKDNAENEVIQSYSSQMAEFAKNVPDVYNYAKEADRLVAPAVQDAILRSTKAPEIIEKIALDPKFANELNNSRDVFDLGRKIAKFELDQPKVKASVSSAPRPPSTPKSGAVISDQSDLSTLSSAEYAKVRQEQRKNRR